MRDDGWILNEDDWEESQNAANEDPATASEETLTGQDALGVVTVHVTAEADFVAVSLKSDWQNIVAAESLQHSVLSAANAATAQVLASSMETFDPDNLTASAQQPGGDNSGTAGSEDTPLAAADLTRLLDAVTADLNQFMSQLSTHVAQPSRTESSGGHVSGAGHRGQVTNISIDPSWAATARVSAIENELTDLLKALQRQSSIGELANGPQSKNISELQAITSNPQQFLRRLGLQPPATNEDRQGTS